MPMTVPPLRSRERLLAWLALLMVFAAASLPAIDLPATSRFADSRSLHGLPFAMDVSSNLPFLCLGVLGLCRLHRLEAGSRVGPASQPLTPHASLRDCAWLFFAGLVATSVGSAFYHLAPDGARLAADRAGMTIAFAGLVGLALCDRVSTRAGWAGAWFVLTAGLGAAFIASETGNVLPWALVQFGGMALVAVLAGLRPVAGARGLRLGWIVGLYALAKLLELADEAVFELTRQLVSGHSLKHVVAALAALPVLQALRGPASCSARHNPGAAAISA